MANCGITGSITDSVDMSLSKLREIVEGRGAWYATQSMGSQRAGHSLVTEQQQQSVANLELFQWSVEDGELG